MRITKAFINLLDADTAICVKCRDCEGKLYYDYFDMNEEDKNRLLISIFHNKKILSISTSVKDYEDSFHRDGLLRREAVFYLSNH